MDGLQIKTALHSCSRVLKDDLSRLAGMAAKPSEERLPANPESSLYRERMFTISASPIRAGQVETSQSP
jgi:hypothetical protein